MRGHKLGKMRVSDYNVEGCGCRLVALPWDILCVCPLRYRCYCLRMSWGCCVLSGRDKGMVTVLASEAFDTDSDLSIPVSFIASKKGWMEQGLVDALGPM